MTNEFVKELTEEEKNEILKFILEKFDLNEDEAAKEFYSAMVLYIKTVRRDINTFKFNIDEIIEMLTSCGYDNDEIMQILTKEPSLLHSNKLDVFWRILILGKVNDTKTNIDVRKDYLIKNPRILRTSQDVMYARVKYLLSDEVQDYLRKDGSPTVRQVVKLTHSEFEDSYKISKEELVKRYPFDNDAQVEVVSWDENKELLDSIYGSKK